ncbi:MAG: hypothetical protein AB9866_20580 [Syntrophobacteraceae bacterium]
MPVQRKNYCPHVKDPFEECYISEMDSQDIEKAIAFCAGSYEKCEIYIKNLWRSPDKISGDDKR